MAVTGLYIREMRRYRGMTQTQIAIRVGLSRTSITNIEQGRQMLTLETLYKLCWAFDCALADLLPAADELLQVRRE